MISTWSKGPSEEFMSEALLMETLDRVRRHPWWHARAKLALSVLDQRGIKPPAAILDAGCGWGVTLQALEDAGYRATGMDISRGILELIDRPSRTLIEADLNQPRPTDAPMHDALFALDVIEHLDDDRGAVAQMAQLLKPGGVAVISVPALPELFSEFDRIQGHRRRYVPDTLRAAFQNTGFGNPQIFWWGAWMVGVLRRMRSKEQSSGNSHTKTYSDYLRVPTWPIPLFMNMAYAWEKNRALNGRLSTGTSLFAVAVKQ